MVIPQIIMQTGKTRQDINDFSKQWQALNSSFTYMFYDDEECRAFLKEYYSTDVLWAFNVLKPGAFKADLFRYCFLYIKGGVYVDLDCVPLLPLENFLDIQYDFISVSERRGIPGIYQAFIACIPGCIFLKHAIYQIVENCRNRYRPSDLGWTGILSITGPVLLGKMMQNKYTPGRHKIFNCRVLLFRLIENDIIDENNRRLIYTKFEGFNGQNYAKMVRHNQIYGEITTKKKGFNVIVLLIFLLVVFCVLKCRKGTFGLTSKHVSVSIL